MNRKSILTRIMALILAVCLCMAVSSVFTVSAADEEHENVTLSSSEKPEEATEAYVMDIQVAVDEDIFAYGDGSEKDPFVISCAREFANFRNEVNKGSSFEGEYIKLTADINLKDYCGEGKDDWTPVGIYGEENIENKSFRGTFDGDGHTISGLYIGNGKNSRALFALTGDSASVKNLNVEGIVKSTGKTAGIVAHSGGIIDNCSFKGTVSSSGARIGGIAGEAFTVTNCRVEADVSGNYNIGGIVGFLRPDAKIENCSARGNVTGTDKTGGIVGQASNNNTISNCTFSGNVTAASGEYIGGIAGLAANSRGINSVIDKCTFEGGKVTGPTCVGGIVGGSNVTIKNCASKGSVECTAKSVGFFANGGRVGGIAGLCEGPVTGCANSGSVKGTNDVGGIAGYADACKGHEGTITACINQGDVTGESYVAGIVGYTDYSVFSCKNYGKVNGVASRDSIKGGGNGYVKSSFLAGSNFGTGSLIVITCLALAGIAAVVIAVVFKKKRGEKVADDDPAEAEE